MLLFSVTPGLSEVAEAAVHLIAHRDLPHHGEPNEAHDDHNCTSLAHHCGSHSMSAQPAIRSVAAIVVPTETLINPSALRTGSNRACEPPPLRPPIV